MALAFVLVLLGALASAGPLKRADAVGKDSATRCDPPRRSGAACDGAAPGSPPPPVVPSSLDAFFSRPDFQVFNHRMRAFRSRLARARGEKE